MTSPSLENNPRISTWLSIEPDGRVLVRSGKVELGQGLLTALAQIAADSLGVDPGRVVMVPAATDVSPDEAYTAGSLSVQHSGTALRAVCARARALFVAAAAERLGEPADALTVEDGLIGGRLSYWELAGDVSLDVDAGAAATGPAEHRAVGRSLPRLDVPDKVAGRPRFIHDLRPEGMLFGRVLRPPSRGAVLMAVDDAAARAVPGVVAVVRDGSFLGVVAEREENALRALEALRGTWREADSLPDERDLPGFLLAAPTEETVLADTTTGVASVEGLRRVRARFSRPYLAHASIAPSCGLARWDGGRLTVWSHTQGVHKLRTEICRSLGLAGDAVVVRHVEGAGCYGHNAADDAAYDAVLLARAVPGRPVQVVWTRQDELGWGPLGPAMVVEIEADVDPAGRVHAWRHEVWSNGHSSRPASPGSPPLLAATLVADARPMTPASDPPPANGAGSGRNAVPGYDLPNALVRAHRLQTMPLRTSALRALGAHLNVYAIESVVDELAELAGTDPVGYRLGLLSDPRARDVLRVAAERAGWPGEPAAGRGLGVGVARYKGRGAYCAVVAEVEAETSVRVRRLTIAVDVGLAVNPDGVVNQIEGGALQALSWTTKEQVRFDARTVTSTTWEDYPILTFSEVPPVDVVLLDRPDEPSLGAGEASIGPTAAAIGNALAAALGVRVRTLPLTPENVVAALG
jgi:CO/xanthine dehydrogenase Mo-binding subunit